jgi:hypothetical protein
MDLLAKAKSTEHYEHLTEEDQRRAREDHGAIQQMLRRWTESDRQLSY